MTGLYYTKKCVICLDKVHCWGGHVHDHQKKKTIIAGLCEKHENFKDKSCTEHSMGCYGSYDKRMGKELHD